MRIVRRRNPVSSAPKRMTLMLCLAASACATGATAQLDRSYLACYDAEIQGWTPQHLGRLGYRPPSTFQLDSVFIHTDAGLALRVYPATFENSPYWMTWLSSSNLENRARLTPDNDRVPDDSVDIIWPSASAALVMRMPRLSSGDSGGMRIFWTPTGYDNGLLSLSAQAVRRECR